MVFIGVFFVALCSGSSVYDNTNKKKKRNEALEIKKEENHWNHI